MGNVPHSKSNNLTFNQIVSSCRGFFFLPMATDLSITTLLKAAQQKDWQTVNAGIAAITPTENALNQRDSQGMTLLLRSIVAGQASVAQQLINLGAGINKAFPPHQLTPLMAAASYGQFTIAQQLLQTGAEVNQGNADNSTALMIAVYRGNLAMVELLVSHGATVNWQDTSGSTPLKIAIEQENPEITTYLIQEGAIADIRMGLEAVEAGKISVLEGFLAAGGEINQPDDVGDTALHLACLEGHQGIVERLLNFGAKVDVVNRAGDTPLLLATVQGETKIVNALLQAGAAPNLAPMAESPLAVALTSPELTPAQRFEIVQALLMFGADTNFSLPTGQSPLAFGKTQNWPEITNLLTTMAKKN